MSKLELTNMVMVIDPETKKVLVINRKISWCGIAFPGGHAEEGESIRDSAVRELYEETGLTINNPVFCGYIYWYNRENGDKYFTYMYKTSDFAGTLSGGTEEGEVFWLSRAELEAADLAPNMHNYLKIFDGERSEAFCAWRGDEPREIIFT